MPFSEGAEDLIDAANDAIEAFMLRDQKVIEFFVTSDFHLFDQAVTWIEQNNLLTGDRFCEFGAGFGVCAMLAALRGMDAIGIEIEPDLVDSARQLANELGNDARFYRGSFVPSEVGHRLELASEAYTTDEDGVYDVIGNEVSDFDLVFAFPWPGEYSFFESIFDASAADGALMLTYQGREGMHLVRKA